MSIKAIDHASVHRLTSGQVVIDLQTAVKELLENALDAGATSIELRFKEHGLEFFEVIDNGKGIRPSDYNSIALKHHTSKLESFNDLTTVSTLGFRGEALSSLCGTCTAFTMVTATQHSSPIGTSLTFLPSGECVVGGKAARQRGTTVKVEGLFGPLPVRRKELEKNLRREFGKAVELVQAYALVSTSVRIEVKNWVKGKPTTHLHTPLAPSVRQNFSSIFTPKSLSTMLDLDLSLSVAPDKSVVKHSAEGNPGPTTVLVKGLISRPVSGQGRATGSRQFFYVNGRPFSPARIAKAFNEVYKAFNVGSYPCVVADFQLPPDTYDVNVSPDKRSIFLHSEGNLISALKVALEEVFQPSRQTFPMASLVSTQVKPVLARPTQPAPTAKPPLFVLEDDNDDELVGLVKEEEADERPSKRRKSSPVADEEAEDDVMVVDEPAAVDAQVAEPSQADSLFDSQEDQLEPTPPAQGIRSPTPPAPLHRPIASTSRSTLDVPALPPLHLKRSLTPEELLISDMRAQVYTQPTLLQMTLDTSGASWAVKQPGPGAGPAAGASRLVKPPALHGAGAGGKGKGKGGLGRAGSRELEKAQRHIRQFVHPSEVKKYIDDQAGVSGDEEEDEEGEDGEGNVEGLINDETDEEDGEDGEEGRMGQDEVTHKAGGKDGCCDGHSQVDDDDGDDGDDDLTEAEANLAALEAAGQPPPTQPTPSRLRSFRDEVTATAPTRLADQDVPFDIHKLAARWSGPTKASAASAANKRHRHASRVPEPGLAGASVEGPEAEAVLSRTVGKEDFGRMEVIGQFNLGFIIARRKAEGDGVGQDDLFIVDQHASDEKYNFERLQADTVIQSQRLIAPRALGLPSHDEITAIEHVAMLRLNGFELAVDEDAAVGQRVKLLAQPVSRDTVFGVADLEELLDLIAAAPAGEVVRPTKARRMFASRACRKSVMIGKALNRSQMTAVVRHMGTMEQPWNCPHGRPTMRWLANLVKPESALTDDRDYLFELLQSCTA